MTVRLHGMRASVYVRIARVALLEKGVPYQLVEVDPFAADMPAEYLNLHPFRRVPTFVRDGFVLYETTAITRYIDEAFAGPLLQPSAPQARARMAQIIAIIDNYGYWPMVRQVFSHSVFRPKAGAPSDPNEIRAGIVGSERVLTALDALITPDGFLVGPELSLADIHLAPMIAYFVAAPEGAAALNKRGRLMEWWDLVRTRASMIASDPSIST